MTPPTTGKLSIVSRSTEEEQTVSTTTVRGGNVNVGADTRLLVEAQQGELALLDHLVARELLRATLPARLAYTAGDGTPRVVPVLFHWTGEEVVLSSWPDDPKVAALQAQPRVALTIDTADPPFKVLSIRGTATVTIVDGMAEECLPTFTRYFGPEEGRARAEQMGQLTDQMARIAVRPNWVDILDFVTRFPNGMVRRTRKAPT